MMRRTLLLVLLAAGCTKPPAAPQLQGLTPSRGTSDRPTPVVIAASGLRPKLLTDFTNPAGSVLDQRFSARLGREPLTDVQLAADGSLTAVVPAGLPAGPWDLTVTTPEGAVLVLPRAFQVLATEDLALLVEGFRFEPVAPQRLGVPFLVTVSAVDGAGATVEAFAGTATLGDETGTVVPKRLGPFSRGTWQGLVEVRAPHEADVLRVVDGANRGASNAFAVRAGPVHRLAFVTPARTVVAGECSAEVRVELHDDADVPTAPPSDLALALSDASPSAVGYFSDAACTTPLAAVTLAAGSTGRSFYFRTTRARDALELEARAAGVLGARQVHRVTPAASAQLAFLDPPPTLNADVCSPALTLEVQDRFGNPAPLAAATPVTVAPEASSGLGVFRADGCLTAASAVPFAAGATRGQLQLQGTVAGWWLVTASAPGLGSATVRVRISPAGFPTRLAFVSPPQQLAVSTCSAGVALQTQDSFGNAVAHPGAATASLAAAPGVDFVFYADAACTTPTTSVAFGPGRDTEVFYFRGRRSGPVTLTASATDLQQGQQAAVLLAGAPSQLQFTSAPQALVAGGCSGALEVRLADADGNAAQGSATVQFTATPSALFFLDAACTQPGDALALTDSGSLFVRPSTAGSLTVTASSAGLAPAQQQQTVAAGPAAQLAFTSAPQSLAAGACSSAATLELRDAWGNPTSPGGATPVSLTATPAAGFGFFSDPGCATAATGLDLASRDYVFFRGTQPGQVVLSASASMLAPATQQATIVAGAAARLAFVTAPHVTTAGTCSPAVVLEARDASGNPTRVAADTTVALTASALSLFSDAACSTPLGTVQLTAATATASFFFRGTVAGDAPLDAAATALTSASQVHRVTPAPADRLRFSSAAFSVNAGACSPAMTFARVDAFGNESPGAGPTVVTPAAAPAAGVSFFADASCGTPASAVTLAAGTAAGSVWLSATTAGSVDVTVSATGLAPATQTITVSAANAATRLAFVTPPRSLVAGACSLALTVETRDSFGNPRPVGADTAVTFSGASFFADPACGTPASAVTIASGQGTGTVYARATQAGTVDVVATAPGLGSAAQPLTVTAAPASALAFVTGPQTVVAGSCSAVVTVETRDAYGNPSPVGAATPVALSSTGLSFFSDASCGTAASTVSVAGGQARASFSFRGTVAGAQSLTAQVSGWAPVTQSATITPAAPSRLVFTTPPRAVAAGACSLALTLEVRDAFDNASPVSAGTTVSLSASPASGFSFFADAACGTAVTQRSLAAGESSGSFFVRGLQAGTVTLTASAPGLAPVTQAVTVSAAAGARLAFVTPPRSTVAGACSDVLTLELRDAWDNVTTASAELVIDLGAAPALGFSFSDAVGCSPTTTTVRLLQGNPRVSFHTRGTASGTVGLTAASSGLTSATQNATITPAAAASFSWAPIASPRSLAVPFGVAVTARDAFANVATDFVGTGALSLAPAGVVACTSGCTSASETGAFVNGAWAGTVTVSDAAAIGTGRTLTLARGALSGTSNAFTVSGAAARTPPLARFTVRGPTVLGAVTLDATASSDYQTAASALQVSWDGTSAQTGAPPWTAWTTTKSTTLSPGAGLHRVRLAVRDADGDVATRLAFVRVFGLLESSCVVTTNADVDDGAVSCSAGFGTDGQLSLAEAIRIANGSATPTEIAFDGPMTITGTGAYTLSRSVSLYGQSGVQLVGKTFNVAGAGVTARLYGLALSGPSAVGQLTASGSTLELHDVTLTNTGGFRSTGTELLLEQVSFSGCSGPCLEWAATSSGMVRVLHSEFKASPSQPAVRLSACAASGPVLDVVATTFTDLGYGVQATCDGTVQVRHATFDAVGVGLAFAGGADHVVANNLFSTSGLAASCGTASFATRAGHGLFNNTDDGCLAGDLNPLLLDPLYAFPASRDVRLSAASPARDSASDLALDLTLAQPGNHLGPSPDRGGRETY